LQWKPTREGYLRFLAESRAVYTALEAAVASDARYAALRATGLERVASLDADIAWFKSEHGLEPPALAEDGPGKTYALMLTELAANDPPAFICHFYNVYFAHTAGGRMIGTKLSDMLLDRKELQFYQYGGADHKPLLDAVRSSIDAAADGWTRDQKDACLNETAASFRMSGALLRAIAGG
jgi:heme oxygenase